MGDGLDRSNSRGSIRAPDSESSADLIASMKSKKRGFENPQTKSNGDSNSSTANARAESNARAGGEVAGENLQSALSVANQRGSNWALPAKTAGATGYVRPIRLFCGADYLELKSGGVVDRQISMAGGTAEAIDPLVEQIWGQIKSWGVAGKNGYWKPQLRVTVLPGGETRFSELNGLLYNSGLLIEESRQ
jgi:hypothetical protein